MAPWLSRPISPVCSASAYQVADGRGGSDGAEVTAFVNPVATELDPPVLAGSSDRELSQIARACTSGVADQLVRLEGPAIRIEDMAPGERIQVIAEPGQQIELQSRDFVRATYLVVDGGLLVITPNGNIAYFDGFADAAESDAPPMIAVAEGPRWPATGSSPLWSRSRSRRRLTLVWRSPACRRRRPGPTHWGGADFTAYDPGSIGPGLDPLGPLLPTALGLGTPPLLDTTTPILAEPRRGRRRRRRRLRRHRRPRTSRRPLPSAPKSAPRSARSRGRSAPYRRSRSRPSASAEPSIPA